MYQKSKSISGQRRIKKRKASSKSFSVAERHAIIKDYLSSGCSKREIWEKYTGQNREHGQLLNWMRILGYESSVIKSNFAFSNKMAMEKTGKYVSSSEEEFEILQLKKRIAELEIKLKDAEMKAIAFSTMVDIAEEEFKIPIKKKYNTKLSK